MVASPGPVAAPEVSEKTPPAAATEVSRLVLEVTRGRTRFRRRPVTSRRFLIGAGVTCDLRLGGEGMPALHSLIVLDGHQITLEAIAPLPELRVNGQVVREAALHDGDVISLGEVELLALVSPENKAPQAQTPPAAVETEHDQTPLSELSAMELIERIEAEKKQIEQFEGTRSAGYQSLLHAYRTRSQEKLDRQPAVPRRQVVPPPHFLRQPSALPASVAGRAADDSLRDELEQLGRQLEVFSQELRDSAQRSLDRDSSYTAMSDTLLDTQQQLVAQLEGLLAQVESLHQGQQATARGRAIA